LIKDPIQNLFIHQTRKISGAQRRKPSLNARPLVNSLMASIRRHADIPKNTKNSVKHMSFGPFKGIQHRVTLKIKQSYTKLYSIPYLAFQSSTSYK